jgi:shikimate dehydrogenase
MSTKCAVVGHPVLHSLSPVIHNAGYVALGIDWEYEAIEVEIGTFDTTLTSLWNEGYRGFNVTMPFKAEAHAHADHLHDAAKRLGSVNTLVKEADGLIHGYSTDGDGFILSLAEENISVSGMKTFVIGAGGASRAICDALVQRGAELSITARKKEQAHDVIRCLPEHDQDDVQVIEFDDRNEYLAGCDMVINATPIGMAHSDESRDSTPIDPAFLSPEHIIVDTIYHPLETELIRSARAVGCVAFNGVGMLLHQAAISFSLMTSMDVPLTAMKVALEHELVKREVG